MASYDKELAEQLMEAGNALMEPPSSVDELLPLLDRVENSLSRVEQSPSPYMQNALSPSVKALVTDQLFRHSDADVKVAVAACISEITRITAPEAPFDDEKMKEVFQLIVSSFENLFDKSSRLYSKRTSILETVAKVRSCVVMLDLECDGLIIEMFQHFLKSVREDHPENVFSSMETIMTLVLEESEDISPELLSPLLASLKRNHEEVLPDARKLAERVLKSCATKLQPYMTQAVKTLNISLDDYSKVVSSICQESSGADEQNDAPANEPVEDKEIPLETVSAEVDLTKENFPKSVVSNGIPQPKEDETLNSLEKQDGQPADQPKHADTSSTAEPDNLVTKKLANTESKAEQNTKKREKTSSSSDLMEPSDGSCDEKEAEAIPEHKSDNKDALGTASEHKSNGEDAPGVASEEQSVDTAISSENKEETLIKPPCLKAAMSSENKEETLIRPSSPKATDGESEDVVSPTASGNLPDESHPKRMGRLKKEQKLVKDITPADDASKRTSEGTSDSEAKPNRQSGKKIMTGESKEDKTPTVTDETRKESGTASDSEAKPVKQAEKKVDANSNNPDGSSSKQQDNKKRSRGKVISEKDETKTSTKNDEMQTVTSPKSAKPIKDEPHVEETAKTNAKRKLTPGKDKASGSMEYGENLVGSKVKVWWPHDKVFYEGVIDSFDPVKKKHKVLYNDGDEEILTLKRERWEFIGGDSASDEKEADQASPDSSSEMPPKKKAKATKQAQMDISPKMGGGGSSSKSKGAATKSSHKSKEGGKVDSKLKDGSKAVNKSEDDSSRSKDHKVSGKSKNEDGDAPKSSKSKEDSLSTPKPSSKLKQDTPKVSKSKHETPKSSSTAKGKPPKSGGKFNPNGSRKLKSGSSKVRESEDVKENSTDSAKGQESVKGKSAKSSKVQPSGSKSGKKRRR